MQKTDINKELIKLNQYNPFGIINNQNSEIVGFSSECVEIELNLIYYNYRYYSPQIASWLSRDIIFELGFISNFERKLINQYIYEESNLYLFIHNNPLLFYDNLGLIKDCWEARVKYFCDNFTGKKKKLCEFFLGHAPVPTIPQCEISKKACMVCCSYKDDDCQDKCGAYCELKYAQCLISASSN